MGTCFTRVAGMGDIPLWGLFRASGGRHHARLSPTAPEFEMRPLLAALAVSAALISPARAQAPAGELALVCSFLEEWCRLMATGFERETGIRVAMLRR
jgi:hypothetical protein